MTIRFLLPAGVLLVAFTGAALAKPCPTVMLVLDTSASMAQDVGGHEPGDPAFVGPSKWELGSGLVLQLLKAYGTHVPFGLELFSTAPRLALDDPGRAAACFDTTRIAVEPGHSVDEMTERIREVTPHDVANTGEAVARAANDTALLADPRLPPHLILITDGHPGCHPDDARFGDARFTRDQIAAARVHGVNTFVIGFDGPGADAANLDRMARAGGILRTAECDASANPPSPCYFGTGPHDNEFFGRFGDLAFEFREQGEGDHCDDTCYTLGCAPGHRCVTTQSDSTPYCKATGCDGPCAGETFCRDGRCVPSCPAGCPDRTICEDGVCVPSLCDGVTCSPAQICQPRTGHCIDFPCLPCNARVTVCNAITGRCDPRWCDSIHCPDGQQCVNNGNCQRSLVPPPGGGCGCNLGGAGVGPWAAMVVLALLCAWRLATRRSH